MFNTIEEYLDALKNEMKGADSALMRDALSDAQEHLSTALAAAREQNPEIKEPDKLQSIIEEYGSPEETASAYREVERLTSPALKHAVKPRSLLGRFFGVYADARAWGALFYMFITFVTGTFYFSWVITGLSTSVSLAIFVFGLPIALLYLMSVRGLALLEGRLVEALLGIRMPRRPMFLPDAKWLDRLKELATDKHVWLMQVYMVVQFALGIVYIIAITFVLGLSLSFIVVPFLQEVVHEGIFVVGSTRYFLSPWSYPLFVLVGILLGTTFMHLARGVGQLHGRFAKWMLVKE